MKAFTGLSRIFSIDTRSLAAFRVAIGSILFFDILDRARFASAHYANDGVFPPGEVLSEFVQPLHRSFHYFETGSTLPIILFALALLAAVSLNDA